MQTNTMMGNEMNSAEKTQMKKQRRRPFDSLFAFFLLFTLLLRTSEQHDDDGDASIMTMASHRRILWQQRQLSSHHHFEKAVQALDFSTYSCNGLYQYAMNHTTRCAFAQTCNEGDGIFAPVVYCSEEYSTRFLSICLGIPLTLFLIILFRVLGSTAEEFFSPGLEVMSLEMGLPERFAGVTLLALGNGAPDVASTVSAILNDRKMGYKMALGELTGAAMVASTVIVGAVTFVADGVPCRGPLVRDVVMFIITMIVVYFAFDDGSISVGEIHLFVSMYLVYVLVVLAADMYHRRLGGPSNVLSERGEAAALVRGQHSLTGYDTVTEAISNYDMDKEASERLPLQQQDIIEQADWGRVNEDGAEPLMVFHPHHGGMVDLKMSERCVAARSGLLAEVGQSPESWAEAWALAWTETNEHIGKLWGETYHSDKYNAFDKFLMACELPFTVVRMLTIPVPCDGYYCRPIVAVSIALCPFWLWYYHLNQFDVNLVDNPPIIVIFMFLIPAGVGLAVLRYAPRGGVPPRLSVAVPITLIGFVASATWLDLIADVLVDLLSFFGVLCRIPSTIMGLTVLAWGNSSQDMIANMTVARKGLSTMAITASFAGPVFNILIGLGIGLSLLYNMQEPGERIPVELNNPLRLGFLFSVINGALVITCGLCIGKGYLPKKYCYVALGLYSAYVVASLTM